MIKLLTYLCFLFILSGCNKVEWVLDDKNSNDEFDTFLSIPNEKFGFSNDAKVFAKSP